MLGAVAGVSLKALKITQKPQEYISLAKLVAGGRMVLSTQGAPQYQDYLQDFYGTIIETLESAAMRRQAIERTRLLNPYLKECNVDVHVTQNKGSAIFNIAAIGNEPKFTRVFLDSLLDEFRAFRDQIREGQRNRALTALAEDVVKREERLKELRDKLTNAQKSGALVNATKLDGLTGALKELVSRQAILSSAQSDERNALGLQIDDVSAEISKLKEKTLESDRAQSEFNEAERAYKEMFDLVHRFQVSEEMSGDYVNIMQRAEASVENIEPWVASVINGAVMGGFVGMIMLLIFASIYSGGGPSSYPLPPPPIPVPASDAGST